MSGIGGNQNPSGRNQWTPSPPDELDRLRTALAAAERLIGKWKGLAVMEREMALTKQPMTPTARSNHNHRALVYEACANDLATLAKS